MVASLVDRSETQHRSHVVDCPSQRTHGHIVVLTTKQYATLT